MKFKAKDRMVLVNKKNMKKIIKYFNVDDNELYDGDFNLSWAVNYLVNIAVGELKAIEKNMNIIGVQNEYSGGNTY